MKTYLTLQAKLRILPTKLDGAAATKSLLNVTRLTDRNFTSKTFNTMAARNVETPARNTSRSGSFGAGTSMAAPGSAAGAGGGNLKKPRTAFNQSGGGSLNKGRSGLGSARERHLNGGTKSISKGSTEPSR